MHFTFADGAIGYDCVRCGARCCRGLGFGLRHEELIPFLEKAPKLSPFLQIHKRTADAFDLADGCWLLEEDGRCGVEITHGREAKPAVCRLFPLFPQRLGNELVVNLKLLSCPLEDAARLPPGAAVVRHAEAAAEVAALAEPFAQEVKTAPGAPDDLLAREARIREAAREAAGDAVTVIARAHAIDEAGLRVLRGEWARLFQLEQSFEVAKPLALVLPLLRWAALTTPGAPPWPRLERSLPRQLLATTYYMELSARAGREPSLRGFAEVWRSTASVRVLLSRWDRPARLRELDAPVPDELGQAYRKVAESPRPIGEALLAAAPGPVLAPLLVRLVADRALD